MKNSIMKTFAFAAGLIGAVTLYAADGKDSVTMIDALKFEGSDFAGAEKVFAAKKPGVVFPLVKLSAADMARISDMVDENRTGVKTMTATGEDYHYTLDSASEQFEKELKKQQSKENAQVQSKIAKAEDCTTDFFMTATNSGLVFMFYNSNNSYATYEIFMEPLDVADAAGFDTIHLTFQQGERFGVNAGRANYDTPQAGAISDAVAADRKGHLYRFEIPWSEFKRLIGSIPLKNEQVQQWRIQVFRWGEGCGFSLSGLPGELNQCYVIVPSFIRKTEMAVKSEMVKKGVDAFYYVDQKKGGTASDLYLKDVMSQYDNTVFKAGETRYKLPNKRIAYPRSFSEYYLAWSPRKVEDNQLEDEDLRKEKNFRIVEWMDYMLSWGDEIKKKSENSAMVDWILKYELVKYTYPDAEYWKLRMEAIGNRVFSDKFLNKD